LLDSAANLEAYASCIESDAECTSLTETSTLEEHQACYTACDIYPDDVIF
jgi:hypothetical protein